MPLRYTMEEGSVVEFPLKFCPGKRFDWRDPDTGELRSQKHVTPDTVLQPCIGYWGIAIKEWQVIKQTYPASAQNLNRFTMTVDVDIYDEAGDWIDISEMPLGSPIKIGTKRMEEKDKLLQTLNITDPTTTSVVDVAKRLDLLKRRGRPTLIHHKGSFNNV